MSRIPLRVFPSSMIGKKNKILKFMSPKKGFESTVRLNDQDIIKEQKINKST